MDLLKPLLRAVLCTRTFALQSGQTQLRCQGGVGLRSYAAKDTFASLKACLMLGCVWDVLQALPFYTRVAHLTQRLFATIALPGVRG